MQLNPRATFMDWIKIGVISTLVITSGAVAAVILDFYYLQQEKIRWQALHPGVHGYWQACYLESFLENNPNALEDTERLLNLRVPHDADNAKPVKVRHPIFSLQ